MGGVAEVDSHRDGVDGGFQAADEVGGGSAPRLVPVGVQQVADFSVLAGQMGKVGTGFGVPGQGRFGR
jgi:hypothetical protein